MKRRISFLIVFALLSLCGAQTTTAQSPFRFKETTSQSGLTELGVVLPDGKKDLYLVLPETQERLKKELGVVDKVSDVYYVPANSWEIVARVATASADDLRRTVADLVARLDALEKRIDELEKKVH